MARKVRAWSMSMRLSAFYIDIIDIIYKIISLVQCLVDPITLVNDILKTGGLT